MCCWARALEGVHVELGDGIALADQAEELALGGPQGCIGHHVEQTDVQLADVLVLGALGREHGDPFVAQTLEGGQGIVGDDRHLDVVSIRKSGWYSVSHAKAQRSPKVFCL
jgi:hypothetical protein